MFVFHKLLENPYLYTHLRKIAAGFQENTRQFISDNIQKHKCRSVLDLCCGTGDFAIFPSNIKYLGLDVNQSFVKYAQKKYFYCSNIKFKCQNILKTKFQSKYDAIILISTIHHFSDKEMKSLIKKFKPFVNKIIIVVDIIPNPPSVIAQILLFLDQGSKIRKPKEKIKLFNNDFNLIETKLIKSLFAYQFAMVLTPKKEDSRD